MSPYIVKETPGGQPTLLYRDGPREVRIHSAYDPAAEAEKAAAGFSPGRATMVAVSGVGLGYHIDSLRRRFPGLAVVAVEHDPEAIDAARAACPGHLDGVAVITSDADIADVFENIDMAGFRGVAHYVHRPSYLLHREFYDGVMKEMGRYVSSKISDLLTRFEFEERWVENILGNVHRLFTAGRVMNLFGAFAGFPGVIVSAGPSLRKNVGLLAALRERALVVAVDTALGVLGKTGAEPHLVMTLDAQKQSLKHFLGWRGSAVLCADLVAYPAVLRDYPGRAVVSTTSKYYRTPGGETMRETTPLVGWIEAHVAPIGDVQSGGSVATSAFDLLLNAGCSPIILVGQDLAYTGREIHCSGTYHNDEWLPRVTRLAGLDAINQDVIRRRKIKRVPAYGGGGTVVADFVFDLYRSWFEDSARKVRVPVINATGGGARIAHTEERPLEALIGEFPVRRPLPATVLDRALSSARRDDPSRLIAAMRGALSGLRRLGEETDRAIGGRCDARSVEELANGGDIRLILQPFLRKSRTFLARYDAPPDEAGMMVLKDIRAAVGRLAPALEDALGRLESL